MKERHSTKKSSKQMKYINLLNKPMRCEYFRKMNEKLFTTPWLHVVWQQYKDGAKSTKDDSLYLLMNSIGKKS